ncbi:MAG: hypothetical protein CVV02_03860 [Firmicutes bacterium HGW-Firmicutes-7]|nr:MAG: hypothetical protein CVV02_03860 [Firmicutes bacterium HGW-Firmicutes-7]
MYDKMNLKTVISRLEENNLEYELMTLQNNLKIVITKRGGRIFGPFQTEESDSILWMNKAFLKADDFKNYLSSGNWNLGGDRMWIAPEIQFSVKDRKHFWDSLKTPEQIDPGNYTLIRSNENKCVLEQEMSLDAYNLSTGTKSLCLKRSISQCENPLRSLKGYDQFMEKVVFAGYEQEVELKDTDKNDILAEAWNLTQLNPGGFLYVSTLPCVQYVDYYQPIDSNYQLISDNHVRLKITGDRQYKVGYKSAHVFGRLAYYNEMENGNVCLMIRNFFNNPSSFYSEEPPEKLDDNGYSVHVYNDGGNSGGFGELECNAQTIGKGTGKISSIDQMQSWFYIGAKVEIEQILYNLMGIKL